jgi:hypothetical protein
VRDVFGNCVAIKPLNSTLAPVPAVLYAAEGRFGHRRNEMVDGEVSGLDIIGETVGIDAAGALPEAVGRFPRSVKQLALRGARRNSVQRSTNGCLQIVELDESIRLASQFVGDHRWFAPQTGNDGDVQLNSQGDFRLSGRRQKMKLGY